MGWFAEHVWLGAEGPTPRGRPQEPGAVVLQSAVSAAEGFGVEQPFSRFFQYLQLNLHWGEDLTP